MDAVKPPQVEPSLKEIELSVKEGDLLERYLHLHSKLQLVVWIIIESGLICELGLLGYLCYASFTPEVTSQDHFDVIGSTFQVPQGWEACIIIQMILLAINAIVIGLVARGIRNQRLDSKELQTSSNNSNRFVDRFTAQMAKYKFSGEVVEPKEDPNKNVQQEEELTPTFQKMYTQIYLTGAISQFFLVLRIFFIVGEASLYYSIVGLPGSVIGVYTARYLITLVGQTVSLFSRKRSDFDSLHYFGMLSNVLTIAGSYGQYLDNTSGSVAYKCLVFWSLAANFFVAILACFSIGYLPRLFMHWTRPHKLAKRDRNSAVFVAEKEINRIGTIYFWFFSLPIIALNASVLGGALSLVPSAIASIVTAFNVFKLPQEEVEEK